MAARRSELSGRRPSGGWELLRVESIDPGDYQLSAFQCIMAGVLATCVLAAVVTGPSAARNRDAPISTNSTARRSALARFGAMSCGGAHMCGILALSTGLGAVDPSPDRPTVRGLWPETVPWGSSPCIAPKSDEPRMSRIPECFRFDSPNPDRARWVLEHAWHKHGVCAGVASEDDFFAQVCELADLPLRVLREARSRNLSMHATAAALRSAGLPVYNSARNGEVLLSACALRDRRGAGYLWKLADVSQFTRVCRSAAHRPGEPACVPSIRGPACKANADCEALAGCLRCTLAGFCTSRPS